MKMFDLSSVTKPVRDLSNYVRADGSPADAESENDDIIEFITEKDLYGAIPEPIPANKVLPDWYKELGQYVTDDIDESKNTRSGVSESTVKRCAPFMEAMTMGWIIPLPAEVSFKADESGYVDYEWGFNRDVVSNHNLGQVGGNSFPNHKWPVMKFHNYWTVKVPDGYSALITHPMNRPGLPFTTFSGVVDIDRYFNNINAPFMWTGGEQETVLTIGTPMVQLIPFKRNGIINTGTTRTLSEKEEIQKNRTQTSLTSHTSKYRDDLWVHKQGSRNVPAEVVEDSDNSEGSSCPFHRG
ncbi:hypothetical protein M193_gp038 [Halorubrum tailed phage 7]|uniref:hypothetical protein n=1 Tax=Halorubrum tailed phage 7 TaxID=2847108 RepID=UPI0003348B72|nr:hypothetical protein M193_gp038 [Halorubrum tailed phage 7]AGM10910.1 hypothetical protein HRTV7_38 [Halorubrum tailed phage 7]